MVVGQVNVPVESVADPSKATMSYLGVARGTHADKGFPRQSQVGGDFWSTDPSLETLAVNSFGAIHTCKWSCKTAIMQLQPSRTLELRS